MHLAAAQRHEPGADERAAARAHRARLDRRGRTSTPTPSASTSCARPSSAYTPERVAEICGDHADDAPRGGRAARRRASGCSRPCCRASTSPTRRRRPRARSTTSHLLRGMIGRPGAGVLQMNGQPTAQNTRETGANGDLPGLRNWDNPDAHRASWPSCGTSTRRRSRTGRRRRTRCRSSATPSRARSSCCGSRPPTRPSRCPSWRGSGASSRAEELSSSCRTCS